MPAECPNCTREREARQRCEEEAASREATTKSLAAKLRAQQSRADKATNEAERLRGMLTRSEEHLRAKLAAKDAEVARLTEACGANDALRFPRITAELVKAKQQLAALRGAVGVIAAGHGDYRKRLSDIEAAKTANDALRAAPPAGEATAREGMRACSGGNDSGHGPKEDCCLVFRTHEVQPDCCVHHLAPAPAPVKPPAAPWQKHKTDCEMRLDDPPERCTCGIKATPAPAPVASAPLNVGCQHNPEEDDIHACPTCVREGLGMAPVTSAREDGWEDLGAYLAAPADAGKPEERSPFGNCGRCSRPLANYAGEPGACPRGVLNTEENDEACHRYCAESKANPAPADAGKPVGYCNRGGNHPEGLHSFSDTCRGWRLPGKNAPVAEQPALVVCESRTLSHRGPHASNAECLNPRPAKEEPVTERVCCDAEREGWICTLAPGHGGRHEAHTNDENTALGFSWRNCAKRSHTPPAQEWERFLCAPCAEKAGAPLVMESERRLCPAHGGPEWSTGTYAAPPAQATEEDCDGLDACDRMSCAKHGPQEPTAPQDEAEALDRALDSYPHELRCLVTRALAAEKAQGFALGIERAVLEIRDHEALEKHGRLGVVDLPTCDHLAFNVGMEIERASESMAELLALPAEKRLARALAAAPNQEDEE